MNNYLKIASLIGTGTIFLIGCPKPHVPEPPVGPDGGAAATCETVCAHWTELDCEEAKPTPNGESCVAVCENIQQGNLKDDLECQASVESCEQIDDC
jgi:hypothetical protein